MQGILQKFSADRAKKDLPRIEPGQTVKVYQRIKEGDKERIQIFEGLVIAMHRKQGTSATITVRKESFGVGVERVIPLSAPFVEKIEVVKTAKVRRAKLFYMRGRKGKAARMKSITNEKLQITNGEEIDNNSEEIKSEGLSEIKEDQVIKDVEKKELEEAKVEELQKETKEKESEGNIKESKIENKK